MMFDARSRRPASRPGTGESLPVPRLAAESPGAAAVHPGAARGRDRAGNPGGTWPELESSENGEVPVGSIPPERIREVMERLAGGEYDRAEVLLVVAEELAERVLGNWPPAVNDR